MTARPALALAALLAAIALRWLLDPLMHDTGPLVTLYGAVAVAVWAAGYRMALLVVLLGYMWCDYLFVQPRGFMFIRDSPETRAGALAYLFTCTIIIVLGHSMRAAQHEARTRRKVLEVTLRSIGDAVITTDLEGRVTSVNGIAESLTGWKQADAVGRPLDAVFQILTERSRQPVEDPVTRALREGTSVGFVDPTVLRQRDGVERPIEDSAAPICDDGGAASGCVLTFRDISERRALERERDKQLDAARTLAAIVASSDDAIVGKSLDGIIRSWNAAAERLFGYRADQAIGRHISLIIPAARIQEEDEFLEHLRAGRRIDHFETQRVRSDGSTVDVSLTISPIRNEAGDVIGASKIARDITARKLAETERQKFITLIESSTDFIGICDLDAVPLFVNRNGLAMVGLDSLEQARSVSVWDYFFPEDVPHLRDEFFPSVMQQGHAEIEVRFRHFKSGEALWMAYKVMLLKDATGQPSSLATVSQDVTLRKRLADDLRKVAAELAAADRRKNEFVATLAHELRSPLAPMSNMLEVLKRSDADPDLLRRVHDTLSRQLKQLTRLVDDLLDLNRVARNEVEVRMTQVELAQVLHQALETSRPLIDAAGHQLRVTLPQNPVYLRADPGRLTQIFGNLINNSCKYTPPGGEIRVTAECHGNDAVVTIADTGVGIAPEKLSEIFEMFTQLDRSSGRSGGLGIGLALTKRLVELHQGSIEARSAGEGHGSQFVVRLPALEQSSFSQTMDSTSVKTALQRRS
jgi:PAS domain S-box-containing protein